jgi:hypothetical protein
MKMRTIIIAACAVTLALAQVNVARAQSAVINSTHSNIRHPGVVKSGANTSKARQQPIIDRWPGGINPDGTGRSETSGARMGGGGGHGQTTK